MKHVMNQDKGKKKREMTYGDVAYLYVSLFIALVKITVYPILVVVAVGVMLIPLFIFNYLFSDYIYWKEASAIFYIVLVIVVVVFVFLHRRKIGRAGQKSSLPETGGGRRSSLPTSGSQRRDITKK